MIRQDTAPQANKTFDECARPNLKALEGVTERPIWGRDWQEFAYGTSGEDISGEYLKNRTRQWIAEAEEAVQSGDFHSERTGAGAFVLLLLNGGDAREESFFKRAFDVLKKEFGEFLGTLAQSSIFDVRKQVLIESLLQDRNQGRRTYFNRSLEEIWHLIGVDNTMFEEALETRAWGRLLAQAPFNDLGATGCRAVLQAFTPLLVKQNPADEVENLARDAIDWTLRSAETAPPKASLRTPLTRNQAALDKTARRCVSFAQELESLLANAGSPVKTTLASPELLAILAAFDAKAQADKAAKTKEKAVSKENGSGDTVADAGVASGSGYAASERSVGAKSAEPSTAVAIGQGRLPPNLSEAQTQGIAAMRVNAMLDAASAGDLSLFSWLLTEANLPGRQWNDPGRNPMASIATRLCSCVAQVVRRSPKESESASQVAAQMLRMLADTGLDLVQEARNGAPPESNPFLRARKGLPEVEPSGLLTQAWVEILTGQLQRAGVSLDDTVSLLDDALAANMGLHSMQPQDQQTFPRIARSFVEGWQLRDAMKAPVGVGVSATDCIDAAAPVATAIRRKTRAL